MPRCEGLPNGPCPKSTNNRTVKLSQGDLMLCPTREATRFPKISLSHKKTAGQSTTTQSHSKGKDKMSTTGVRVSAGEGMLANGREGTPTPAVKTRAGRSASTTKSPSECHNYCPVCNELLGTNCIHCNICDDYFHKGCSGMSPDTFKTILSIVNESGWVCQPCHRGCHDRLSSLQTASARFLRNYLIFVCCSISSTQTMAALKSPLQHWRMHGLH